MKDKQTKDDVKPGITPKDPQGAPAVVGNETDKPLSGNPGKRDTGRRETQETRDDGDNDDKGELS